MNTGQAVARAAASFEAACLDYEDEQQAHEEEVIRRAEQWSNQGGPYWPYEPGNFAEALGNTTSGNYRLALQALLAKNHQRACQLLAEVAEDYWCERADQRARADIERERSAALQYEGEPV